MRFLVPKMQPPPCSHASCAEYAGDHHPFSAGDAAEIVIEGHNDGRVCRGHARGFVGHLDVVAAGVTVAARDVRASCSS
jgi:hypothetical protein